jgi:hypothetical protein
MNFDGYPFPTNVAVNTFTAKIGVFHLLDRL